MILLFVSWWGCEGDPLPLKEHDTGSSFWDRPPDAIDTSKLEGAETGETADTVGTVETGETGETGDTAETGVVQETGDTSSAESAGTDTVDTGEETRPYSSCEESWIRVGYEAYLYIPSGGEVSVEVTLTTSTDFISLVWEDISAPYGFYVSCTETLGTLTGVILAQPEDEYYASAWNEAEEGVTWHWEYVTALSRDGVAFYSQGNSGDATHFTSTP